VEWCWIASKKQADHASLLLNDVNRVGIGLNHGLGLLATLATMTVYLGAAFLLSWTMAGLALLSAALVMGLLRGQRRHALKLGQGLSAANRAMQGNVQESLSAIKLAKILGSENLHLNAFQGATSRLRAQQLEFSASTSLSRALFQAAGVTLLATYLYVGLSLWQAPLAELLTLVLIFARLIPLFVVLQQQQHQWLHMRAALLETRSLLAHCLAAAEPEAEPKVHASPWPVHQAICLRGISVHYAERRMPALDNLTVRLAARSTTAIIGASGAGKSTLADVLMGLLIPDHGVIEIDGVVLGAAQRRYWRQSVAYVPQEVFLFNDSIRGNLLWGQPPAQDTDLERALRQAAADFVFHLPQGMDTLVGDGGVRLSGGERQRLALARALLRKPSLLILDEATSALDLESEARVREAIEKLQGELTVVIIGHRLPTLEHAEHVIVLDQGRVLNEGSWASLKATTGATI
jgi:ATP-binding cassette subfamily C protein